VRAPKANRAIENTPNATSFQFRLLGLAGAVTVDRVRSRRQLSRSPDPDQTRSAETAGVRLAQSPGRPSREAGWGLNEAALAVFENSIRCTTEMLFSDLV
jgi:hypothetical protein